MPRLLNSVVSTTHLRFQLCNEFCPMHWLLPQRSIVALFSLATLWLAHSAENTRADDDGQPITAVYLADLVQDLRGSQLTVAMRRQYR